MNAVEIEVDGSRNQSLGFRPLQRSIRGRFDWTRLNEPMAAVKAHEWPLPIPSQRLGIDPAGTGYLVEPLHDEEFKPLAELIQKKNLGKLEPALTEFPDIDVPTWLWWIKAAVASGIAKVVSGKLPATIDGEITKDFIHAKPAASSSDKMTVAIQEQTKAFVGLTGAIQKLLENK